MTQTQVNSVLFDPGYAQHTTILSIGVEYLYAQINQFKNLGQRKMKFKMTYPQILKMANNNVGFCLGSLLWAVYIKSLGDNIAIEGNPCLGGTYEEAETVEEVDYSINFFTQIKKDAKYYLGRDYQINPQYLKILELYKEFLTLNFSFVNTKTTGDVKLPSGFKIPDEASLEKIHAKIQEVISTGELLKMLPLLDLVYEG
jgi:hypothetical protein